jgi:hypothetical protein
MPQLGHRGRLIGVGIIAVVFVLAGARGLNNRIQVEPAPAVGAYATTDSYLADQLLLARPSNAVVEALAGFPPDASLLFVGSSDDRHFIQTYYVITYLAWPRSVAAIACDGQGRAQLAGGRAPESAASTILVRYALSTTDLAPAQSIGPRLTITAAAGARALASVCG